MARKHYTTAVSLTTDCREDLVRSQARLMTAWGQRVSLSDVIAMALRVFLDAPDTVITPAPAAKGD